MRFVDTNVLLYAVSRLPEDAKKRRRARELLREQNLAVSVQVFQEFFHQATRPTRPRAIVRRRRNRFSWNPPEVSGPGCHSRSLPRRHRSERAFPAVVLGRGDPRGRTGLRLRRGVLGGSQRPAGLRRSARDQSLQRAGEAGIATDTSERGLERLICTALAGHACEPPKAGQVSEPQAGYGGVGWSCGNPHDYDREYCVDRVQLAAFLNATQPEVAESLALDEDGPTRRKFLARLQGEVSKRGTIEVLRHGIKHGAHDLDLFYGTPSAGNRQAQERFAQNRFTVLRQLSYSGDETQRALDIGLFINGLPVFTFELKNNLTKQTVDDAVWQYKKGPQPAREAVRVRPLRSALRGG